jgi:catechol 2,3-dioxygenase
MPANLSIDHLGAAELVVADLERSVAFYEESLALKVHRREGPVAALGAGAHDLLVLTEEPGAPPVGRHAGLFHFALLYPSRQELARALRRLGETRTPLSGASDHGVSEALYLRDPDDHGIELYSDRPRSVWPDPTDPNDRIGMFSIPLDLEDLLASVPADDLPAHPDAGLGMGHLHLQVGDIDQGLAFYRDVVGFELMAEMRGQAAFVSSNGYHHHLGFNVWAGRGIGPAPEGSARLTRWNVVLDGEESLAALRERLGAAGVEVSSDDGGFVAHDPWRIAARFSAV